MQEIGTAPHSHVLAIVYLLAAVGIAKRTSSTASGSLGFEERYGERGSLRTHAGKRRRTGHTGQATSEDRYAKGGSRLQRWSRGAVWMASGIGWPHGDCATVKSEGWVFAKVEKSKELRGLQQSTLLSRAEHGFADARHVADWIRSASIARDKSATSC